MNPYAIPPLLSSILIALMGFFVYVRNTTSKLNRTFSLFCLSLTVWVLGFTGVYASHDEASALWWARTGFVGVSFIPATMYHFVTTFLQLQQRRLIVALYLSSLFGLAISRTNLVYNGVWTGFWGYYPTAGPLYLIFPVTFSCCFVGGVVLLYLALRKEREPTRRQQIKYVMVAFACGTPGLVDYVAKYQVHIYPFGYITALALISWIAYAMARHRLMDVRLALTRTWVLLGVYGFVVGVPILLGLSLKPALSRLFGDHWWLVPFGVYTVAAFVGPFIYLYFQRRVEEGLLKDQQRYQQILLSASRGMTQIRELKRLLNLVVHMVTKTVGLTHAAIFLYDPAGEAFVLRAFRYGEFARTNQRLPKDDPIVELLRNAHEPVVVAELRAKLGGVPEHSASTDGASNALSRMHLLHASVLVPSFIQDELIGFLVLGDKRSGQTFSSEDLDVFSTLANHAALAVENARFIEELQITQAQLFHSEKMAALGTMGAGMAHQLNNRFMALLDGVTKLRYAKLPKMLAQTHWRPEDREALEGFSEHLESIEEETKKGSKIVRDLTRYARPTPGNELLNLTEIIAPALALLQYKIDFKTFDCHQAIPEDLPQMRGSLSQLEEVFFNLIDNAFDATRKKAADMKRGELPLEPGYRGRIDIIARHLAGPQRLEIVVRDNGIGMKPNELQKIFVPFFTTKATSNKGTGLGLFVIKRIVEAHKGTIEVASTYGEGMTFTMRLPVAKDDVQQTAGSGASAA